MEFWKKVFSIAEDAGLVDHGMDLWRDAARQMFKALPTNMSDQGAMLPLNTAQHRRLTVEEANRPCTAYNPQTLLETLNEFTGKTHTMESQKRLRDTLGAACDGSRNCDFGTIYSWYRLEATGLLRGTDLWESLWDPMAALKSHSDVGHSRVNIKTGCHGNKVIHHHKFADPLRLWDLYSHRVIPFRWFKMSELSVISVTQIFHYANYWAISHSWVADDELVAVTTQVNQEQHPVPLPRDVSLDDIRDELLQLGGQFCWLDILCHRQKCIDYNGQPFPGWEDRTVNNHKWPELEEMRKEEWKAYMPMMGQIYQKAKKTVRWFNGIGREFSTTGWKDDRHWCNRVWTLQETCDWDDNFLTGGYPGGDLDLNVKCEYGGEWLTARALLKSTLKRTPFMLQLAALDLRRDAYCWETFRKYFVAINERVCSNNVDRVNGLNFLLCLDPIPVYQENDTVEKAWTRSWSILHEGLSKAIQVELKLSEPTWQDLLNHLKITPGKPSPRVMGVDKP
ncbi:hypothetical protein L211DRAFT_846603 [Terfezia boudieri ATCC MYA-4762]|uniref:Heterokaryon incompatibility domain-containing protein n=1 Tax=Terfezia boudieri ATCC MYA-4762 TaxID=1051890 RepID=A0A3N4M0Y6_9PEZI|nr:hypothetical protein L211DRAFT_846603 [Terfezia boudieri ATCC MYA-4762]